MNRKEQLIQKLFSNQCSKEELNFLFEMIENDNAEAAPEVMSELMEQMDEVSILNANTSERILVKVLENTNEKKFQYKNRASRLKSRKGIITIRRAAAAVLLLVVASWFVLQEANPTVLVQTDFAEQQSIELPDGSLVKLNANSSLTFENDWDEKVTRKVWLQGEAFFEVAKKERTGQKFQVITKDLTIEVLGTVFNVNSHQEKTKVFLQEGKVNLNLNGLEQNISMEPGEIVAYSQSNKELPKKRNDLRAEHTSWKYGLLLFDSTPLIEVLEKVEEIYGVTIESKDSTNYTRKINTGLPIDNLEEAISLLELTLGLEIHKENGQNIIQ